LENREDLQRDGINPKSNARPPVPAPETEARAGPPAPVSSNSDNGLDETEPSLGQWFASNGFSLIVVALAIGYVLWKFDSDGIWAIVKALLGLSFVIFIHELGHFLAAKWCDVNVTTFSIGFGPAIPGCWFEWGETVYKLSLLPLGGYVQMVGQVDGDEASDGSEDDPRSYRNKGVGQRMLIISAGVIMNAVLAFVCFIIVYMGPGKDRTAAVIDTIDSISPAFALGIRTEMEVEQIGDVLKPTFDSLRTVVVFSGHGDKVRFVGRRPNDPEPLVLDIEPRLEKDDTRPTIGVVPGQRPELAEKGLIGSGSTGPFFERSPASQAQPPLMYGDVILATTDPDDPTKLKDLPRDPRNQQKDQQDFFKFQRRMTRLAGKEVTLRVRRAGEDGNTVEVKVPPAFHLTLGVRMQMGQVLAIREGSAAARAGIRTPDKVNKFDGDTIYKVEVVEADGKTKVFDDKNLDPERLPYQLQQWSERLRQAKSDGPKKVTLHLRRHRTAGGPELENVKETLDWDDGWRFDRIVPLQAESPLAIPELGLAYQVKPVVAGVVPGHQNNPLEAGDLIKHIEITTLIGKDETTEKLDLKNNWANVGFWLYGRTAPVTQVKLTIQRAKETQTVALVPAVDETWPLVDRGWIFMPDERRQKADNIVEAVSLGLRDTKNNMKEVLQTLYSMFSGRVSVKLLGGPITIAKTAYRIAGYDIWEFIFFMGMISINLAVINFLPIPVLDGGHMVFLFYEKIRGRQASEAVRVGATYAGLAVILSLMVFVIYLDLTRK
jgi:regulator of sigma E protease